MKSKDFERKNILRPKDIIETMNPSNILQRGSLTRINNIYVSDKAVFTPIQI